MLHDVILSALTELLFIGAQKWSHTPHGCVTTIGNWSTWRKPVMLGRVELDNTLLTCDQGNFNQITAQSQNQTLPTVMKDVHYHCAIPP